MTKLALFQGVTTPIADLALAIQNQGWQLGQVKWDKRLNAFAAEAQSPHGETIAKFGPDENTAVANTLLAVTRRNHMRTTAQFKVGMWRTNFHERQREIAEAYRDAPIYDPKAVAAWKALGDDSMHRLHVLSGQLHIEPTNDPVPYKSADDMRKDIHEKQHYYLTQAGAAHPVWTSQQVAAFRAVHDILGHGVAGGHYDWPGRVLAASAHFPLLDPTAQQALFTEAVARPAFLSVYGGGPQKIALFPDFLEHQQAANNPSAHRGIHPSQTTAPVGPHQGFLEPLERTSALDPKLYGQEQCAAWAVGHQQANPHLRFGIDWQRVSPDHPDYDDEHAYENESEGEDQWVPQHVFTHDDKYAYDVYGKHPLPHQQWDHVDLNRSLNDVSATGLLEQGFIPEPSAYQRLAAFNNTIDVNRGWDSGVAPLPQNAYIHHGDPLQMQQTMDNASLVDTGWSNFQRGDGSDDRERMKLAIVNAFRVVLLSPRKDLRWNAIHYQDISNIPGSVDDPKVYWDTLENSRRRWNEAQGIDPESHMIYYRFLKPFEARIAANHPEKGWEWAKNEAKQVLFNWWTEEQERIQAEDMKKPPEKQRTADEIERRANEALARRLQLYLKPKDDKTDVPDEGQMSMFGSTWEENRQKWMEERDRQRAEERRLFEQDPQAYYNNLWGGEGDVNHPFHGKFVEWVPIQHVLKYAEWKRNPVHGVEGQAADQDYWNYLKDHIAREGIKDPITLDIHKDDGAAHISEGNHRLAVADALGMTHVPVRVYPSRRRGFSERPAPLMPSSDLLSQEWLRPSDIGFPVQKTAAGGWVYYHVAPTSARESILQHGIDYTKGRSGTDYDLIGSQAANYLWPDIERAQRSKENHEAEHPFEHKWDIWQVNPTGLDVEPDPYGGVYEGAMRSLSPIPPHALTHISKTAAGGQYNLLTGQEGLKYGAFMGTHLKSISQISQHADEILNAALEDVREHDGTGHHFRHTVLALGVPGVGPKVCSFAWLLLQPMTSQLATIDTHMMDVLGHDYEKEMNNRDYFRFEREFRAGLDAAGYAHMPLGAGQWGMWDYKRTGPGSHQDHSAMRVLDPIPHQNVDWVGKAVNLKGESWLKQAPDWWQNTQAARDQAAQEFNQTYGTTFAQNQIPYQDLGGQNTTVAGTILSLTEPFRHYWDRAMPVGSSLESKARTLAEYAKADHMTHGDLQEWLTDHKKDTRLSDSDFTRFSNKMLKKLERLSKTADVNEAVPTFIHPQTGETHVGMPGQSVMEHARLQTGLSVPEIWALLQDEHVTKSSSHA